MSLPKHGNLLDLISKRADKGEMVSVTTENTLLTAYNRMRGSDVSQLPVIDDGRLVGILDEEDLLMNVYRNEGLFSETVSSVMVSKLETLDVQSDEAKLYETLSNGKVAIMFDKETFVGFITKVDLINRYKSAFCIKLSTMKKDNQNYQFATKAIHSGQEPDPSTGAVIGPIYATSTYAQESPGVFKGYDYSRTSNPTRKSLENCIADLESGGAGICFCLWDGGDGDNPRDAGLWRSRYQHG